MKIGRWDTRTWAGLSPNGIGQQKPNHYLEMAKIAWRHKRDLPYSLRILTQGVCDGCALGTAGLHDWTIDGTHLCLIRLELLELNTMRALDPTLLSDTKELEKLTGAELRKLGRLPFPMRQGTGETGFSRVSWDAALDEIAGAISRHGPTQASLYLTSRGLTNEVYYAAQKAWRAIGSPHIDNAARICHSPSTAALQKGVGVSATTCSYKDLFEAELIVLWGANVANNQPVMTKYLYLAKQRGAQVVVVNPYREPGLARYWVPSNVESALFGTKIADHWFSVATGGDIAFASGVLKLLLEKDQYDKDFVAQHTEGFTDLAASLAKLDWDELERSSGMQRADFTRFADLYGKTNKAIFIWSMGLTQHTFGAENVTAVVNLALARGMVGRDGCGLMPIRGHSGVQGGAEMGAYATTFPGPLPITPDNATWLSEQYDFPVPSRTGHNAVQMLQAAERGELGLLYSSGGNFLEVLPDPTRIRRALENVPVRVHQDIVLSSQMLVPAKEAVLLLPAMTRYESAGGGTETTTERRIIFSPEIKGPRIAEARPEWQIFGDLARKVRGDNKASFDDAQSIRNEIAKIIPKYKGIETLRQTGDQVQYGGPHLCVDGAFPTKSGHAHFIPVAMPKNTIPEGKFLCSTRRGKQFNSMVQGEKDPLTGAYRDEIFISADDAEKISVNNGDPILLHSSFGSFHGKVKICRITPRNLAVFWPEGNVLLGGDGVDTQGGVPDYNAFVEITAL